MKYIHYLIIASLLLSFASCSKEEALLPSEQANADRYAFPQGTSSWDQKIVSIYNDFNVKVIYTGFKDSHFNRRSWTVTTENIKGDNLKEQDIEKSVNFINDNIFRFLNKTITNKILPIYIYLAHDMRSYSKSTTKENVVPLEFQITGMDYWSISLTGEIPWEILNNGPINYLTGQIVFPDTPLAVFNKRGMILKEIYKLSVTAGNIKVPDNFNDGFNFTTATVNTAGSEANINNYKKRGFPGQMTVVTAFDIKPLGSVASTNPTKNFIDYIHLCMRHTPENLEAAYPKEVFPIIHAKYAECLNYMLNTYNIDLRLVSNSTK